MRTAAGEGGLQYTRNGAFDISMEDGDAYLVTTDGAYVLDGEGERIQLTKGADGTFDLDALAQQIGIYQFANPFGLQPASGGRFIPTQTSGAARRPEDRDEDEEQPYRLISGALEQSAVELSDEMVMVISTQKAFQFSARIVQTADQIEEIINNLR